MTYTVCLCVCVCVKQWYYIDKDDHWAKLLHPPAIIHGRSTEAKIKFISLIQLFNFESLSKSWLISDPDNCAALVLETARKLFKNSRNGK